MAKRVLIIGAVALGPKVACRLRRLDPEAEITVIDRDSLISYGGCGIPYYVGGDVADIEGLQSTQSHTIRDAKFFGSVKGVEIRTQTEAVEILRREKQVRVRNLVDNSEELLDYDKLVFATGATPVRPPFPGADLPKVLTVSNLHQAEDIKNRLAKGQVGKAVVIGAGAIGIEMAEALTDLWGIETTLIEMAPSILPQACGGNIATVVQRHMEENNVEVMVSETVKEIVEKEDGSVSVVTGSKNIDCDLVILSAGVRPNTKIASEAGLAVGQFGGLLVDRRMRTNDPHIYAGGDCVEIRNLVSGNNQLMPLGSLANRQGRVIANNIHGDSSHFKGTVGTFCIKVFEYGVAKAGLTFAQAKAAGYDPEFSIISQADRAHFYPTSQVMYMVLIADKKSRRVLGVEAASKMGDAVKARVDAVASLLEGGATVADICNLEAGYAPPFASAMDIVNNAGNVLENVLDGTNVTTHPVSFLREFEEGDITILDIRDAVQAEAYQAKYGARWKHIPQGELRQRCDEVDGSKPFFVVCDTGTRSYEAQLVLRAAGINNNRNVQGGLSLVKVLDPNFAA